MLKWGWCRCVCARGVFRLSLGAVVCTSALCQQVFNNAPATDMVERFHDVHQFSSHIAKLMVNEIKKRAVNLSTGTSSLSIVLYCTLLSLLKEAACYLL